MTEQRWVFFFSIMQFWLKSALYVIDTWLKHCSRRIRDELAKQNEETTDLTTKLDKVSSRKLRLHVCAFRTIFYVGDHLLHQRPSETICYYLQEIHSLKAQLEAAKYDVIKYCIGTIVSISAVGLAVLRIVMWSQAPASKYVLSFTHIFVGGNNPLEED